jgi:hypothetical protein
MFDVRIEFDRKSCKENKKSQDIYEEPGLTAKDPALHRYLRISCFPAKIFGHRPKK